METKRKVRTVLKIRKRNCLKVNFHFIMIYTYCCQLNKVSNTYFLILIFQKLTKEAGQKVAKRVEPFTKIINSYGYN